jgi:hypothetical protein
VQNDKMEEDVTPRDEDGVDGRGVDRWDGWVGGLGAVGASSLFGLVRGEQRLLRDVRQWSAAPWRGFRLFVSAGVGGAAIASGSRACPSHSCDGWVCDLGAVGASLIFGLVRGSGSFASVRPTFVLVSRIHLA